MKKIWLSAPVVAGALIAGALVLPNRPAAIAETAGAAEAMISTTEAIAETSLDAQITFGVDKVHSMVVFNIRHFGVGSFWGRFNDIDGEFKWDESTPANSTFNFEVDTSSVDTANNGRDNHLRNADFFNVVQFPKATFKSTGVKLVSEGLYELTGDLTLHGVTKPITAELHWFGTGKSPRDQSTIAGFEAKFSFKRSDFGMTKYLAPDGGEGGGLGNTVSMIVAIEAGAK